MKFLLMLDITLIIFAGRVNSEIVDWISDAGGFQVVSGDFFGSGKLPGPDQGHFLFKSEWNIE